MRPRFFDYVREAFNARPFGMFVAPNWIGLALTGMAAYGLDSAGPLLVRRRPRNGLSHAACDSSPHFQRFVAGKHSLTASSDAVKRGEALMASLADADKRRYGALRQRCLSILEQQFHGDATAPGFDSQSDSLGRLTWMYLRLLSTRQAIVRLLREPARPGEPPPVPGGPASQRLDARLAELRQRLADPTLKEDLRRSLTGQVELLEQRVDRRSEADQKLAFLDAELARIERAGGADSRAGRPVDRSRESSRTASTKSAPRSAAPASGSPNSSGRSARWTISRRAAAAHRTGTRAGDELTIHL